MNTRLADLAAFLEKTPRIALDTEADSLHHYFEKVCLIQISAGGRNFVVDPLTEPDLSALLKVLAGKPLVLHGADYDLRMLRASFGFEPRGEVFDTMLAAQLLGYEQFGLAALLLRFFGIGIPKGGQKSDWSRRPLRPQQIEYAVNDTHYLEPLAAILEKELCARGRLEWHRETCANMVNATAWVRERDPDSEWRIKGSSALSPRGLALLKGLWEWRDEQARAADLPPFKILNNQALLGLLERLEAHPGENRAAYEKLPRNITGRRLAKVREAVARVDNAPKSEWPGPRERRGARPQRNPSEEALARALEKARDEVAARLELPASVLAPKSVVCEAARARPQSLDALVETVRILKWQAEALAPLWLPLLTGGMKRN